MQYSETGTLVVVIPTADGLVVAADSRGVVRGHAVDGRDKLHVASTKRPVVFAITGAADFPWSCPPDVAFEQWMAKPLYAFRASDRVRRHLEQRLDFSLDETTLSCAAGELAQSVSGFLRGSPRQLAEFAGREICVLMMCQTESTEDSTCGWVGLSVKSDGIVVASEPRFERYSCAGAKAYKLFGEWKYVQDVVMNGEGRQFFSEGDASVWNARKLVKDFSVVDGARVATAIIRAAERTTELIPISSGSGIGGPITALILTGSDVQPVSLCCTAPSGR